MSSPAVSPKAAIAVIGKIRNVVAPTLQRVETVMRKTDVAGNAIQGPDATPLQRQRKIGLADKWAREGKEVCIA